MKIYDKIFGLLFLAAISLGCNKNTISGNEGDITIDIDDERYILFDSGISTRGSLVTREYLNSDFGVLGYQYPASWEISYKLAEPNVFDKVPQKVEYTGSQYYTYEPSKIWSGNTYSFFGYYPYDNANIELFDDGNAKQGTPYITYTLPVTGNPRDMVDLMTGSYMDTRVNNSAEVSMVMRHRLSAIDIAVRNYYIYTEDDNSQPYEVTIEFTKMEFRPVVANTKAKIYLDNTIKTEAAEGNVSDKELTFSIVDNSASGNDWKHKSFIVEPNDSDNPYTLLTNADEHDGEAQEDDKKATSIILIPQESQLKYYLDIEYILKYQPVEGGDFYYINADGQSTTVAVTNHYDNDGKALYFDNALVEGRRYNVEITFTASAVTVNITTSDEWDDKEDVKLEFE